MLFGAKTQFACDPSEHGTSEFAVKTAEGSVSVGKIIDIVIHLAT
jgi:hypothetical protein